MSDIEQQASSEVENETTTTTASSGNIKSSESLIEELRRQNANLRLKNKQAQEFEQKALDYEKMMTESQQKAELALAQLAELKRNSDNRVIQAEIRAACVDLGLKKSEYSKLCDFSQAKILDDGTVVGVKESLQRLRETDPDLFKMPTSTNVSFSDSFNITKVSESLNGSVAKMNKSELDKAWQETRKNLF